MVRPDELEAMITSAGNSSSSCRYNFFLKSIRSGPFSWTRSAARTAAGRSAELGEIDRAGEIGHEHPIAGNIERDADPFHQMRHHDRRRSRLCIDGCAVHCVAAWRVAAVGPVEHAIFAVELEIDRLGQMVEEYFDVGAVGGGLAPWDFDPPAQ